MIIKEQVTWEQKNVNRNEQQFVLKKPSKIHNAFKTMIAANEKQFIAPTIVFNAFKYGGPLTWFKPTEFLLKKVGKLGDTYNTKGICIPVNVDIPVEDNMVKPPVELVKEAIRNSSYRVIMNECACRKIEDCDDYPHDIACMFLGKGAKAIVEHKTGREATVEEALAHVDRAIEAGLQIGTYWVEIEQYCWGFQDEDMPDFIAFCFCCPCCCHALMFQNMSKGELKHLVHQSTGWSCRPISYKCVGCGNCVEHCPRGNLKLVNGKIQVHESCAGCGLCLKHCPQQALHVVKVGETKDNLYDYFEKTGAQW